MLIVCAYVEAKPTLLSTQMIWSGSPYNAFTDLIYFENQFLCCFRESNSHQDGENGVIRILSSPDAITWESVALLSLNGYDLRDPKLSVTASGNLLLNMGATIWSSNGSQTINSAVSFSGDGTNWDTVQVLPYPGQWIWHVTWYGETAYGCAYSVTDNTSTVQLMSSPDGIHWTQVKEFKMNKDPNETTIRFLNDGTMVALIRRNEGGGIIGHAAPPYQDWKWFNTKATLGGPDFLILPNGDF